jgi:hypothetical protein
MRSLDFEDVVERDEVVFDEALHLLLIDLGAAFVEVHHVLHEQQCVLVQFLLCLHAGLLHDQSATQHGVGETRARFFRHELATETVVGQDCGQEGLEEEGGEYLGVDHVVLQIAHRFDLEAEV